MTLRNTTWRPALAAAALVSLSACATTAAETAPTRLSLAPADCFWTSQWRGWSSPVDDVVYLRVRNKDIYRLDLLPGSGKIDRGGRFIVSEVRGSNQVCSANDLHLWTSDGLGFRTPVFAHSISMLTPEEAAELPRAYRP